MHGSRTPTEFEERVYTIVRTIPKGQTRSYGWVAQRLGDPGLARAVGNALNRNPYAPSVPCHRVIRSNGTLGGFAGGPARKRALLAREGCAIKNVSQQTLRRRAGGPIGL
jgi:O-6-methylguanine DNA methyltransferase